MPGERDREMEALLYKKLGEFDARIGALESGVKELHADMRTVLDTLAATKGGWKVLATAGAVGAAIASIVIKVVPWLGALGR